MQLNYVALLATVLLVAQGSHGAPMRGNVSPNSLMDSNVPAARNTGLDSQWHTGSSGIQSSRKSKRTPSPALNAVIKFVTRTLRRDEQPRAAVVGFDYQTQKNFDTSRKTTKCRNKSSSISHGSSSGTAKASSSTSAKSTTTKSSTSATPTSSGQSEKASSSTIKDTKNGAGVVGGYWPSWISGTLPPEKIQWDKYDYVAYSFATLAKSKLTVDDSSMLKRFVTAAHNGKSRAVLSVGGWGQSSGFSDAVNTEDARTTFASSIASILSKYDLDGIDIDWEYPGNVDGGTNRDSDTQNFQTFLGELRSKLPKGKLITAAVPQQVWQGSSGSAVGSVARAAAALDYIMLMNYDVWGSSSNPGPNAPLANLCGNSTQPVASAAGGVKAWTGAGMPRNKILLGVPFYGYINKSSKKTLTQRDLNDSSSRHASSQSKRAATSVKGSDGSSSSGQINFSSLVEQKALVKDSSTGEFNQGTGWTKYWDDCSDTPYLANGQYVITYDDTDSLYDKADFARLAGLAGVSSWSIDGDTSSGDLVNALIAGLKAT